MPTILRNSQNAQIDDSMSPTDEPCANRVTLKPKLSATGDEQRETISNSAQFLSFTGRSYAHGHGSWDWHQQFKSSVHRHVANQHHCGWQHWSPLYRGR